MDLHAIVCAMQWEQLVEDFFAEMFWSAFQ